MICPIAGKTYKFVRINKEIKITKSEAEYHVDLLKSFVGFDNLPRNKMSEKIRKLREIDMGRIRREEDGKIVVYGESTTFEYPKEAAKSKVRPKTMKILGKKYPDELFVIKI